MFFHIMLFTTFELETKFWEAHQFWESGVTSYYNLLLPSQNTTKKPLTVFALLNYSAYSLFFSFKRHQRICSTSLSGIFPLTNPLSSQEVILLGLILLFYKYIGPGSCPLFFCMTLKWLLSADVNICFKGINLPIQTSPNWPAPSFFTNLIDSRGISHASLSHGFWGLGLIHAFSNLLHKPSDCSGF